MVKKASAAVFGILLMTVLFARGNALATGQEESGLKRGQIGEVNKSSSEYDPFFGMLHKLNLTEDQKAGVAEVLKTHEAQAKDMANKVAQAGIQLRKDFMNGKFNREHFNSWVRYEQEGAQLRATVMASILPKLNREQQASLRNMQDQLGSNLNSDIDARFARLNDWIAQHSKKRT